MRRTGSKSGFTLIELSVVLVIIGLIVGGILVGQDLIKAAGVRAQITQIEKYNSAVNTFRVKFNAIPGDMPVVTANQFGFTVGAGCDGHEWGTRDGDGIIASPSNGVFEVSAKIWGETALFWQNLSSAVAGKLIDGEFPSGGAAAVTCNSVPASITLTQGTTYIGDYVPVAKIGYSAFVYATNNSGHDGYNWFNVQAVSQLSFGFNLTSSAGGIPVIMAYNMDKKIDDGLPTTGVVQALMSFGGVLSTTPNSAATDNTTTCYNTTSNTYSISSLADYGSHGNCPLSFRFQ